MLSLTITDGLQTQTPNPYLWTRMTFNPLPSHRFQAKHELYCMFTQACLETVLRIVFIS